MASSTPSARGDQGRMPKRRILPALIAQLTLYIAFVAPSSYSLAVRIQDLAPESRDTALSLAIGIPCAIVILITPLVGVLSDRTRSAWGAPAAVAAGRDRHRRRRLGHHRRRSESRCAHRGVDRRLHRVHDHRDHDPRVLRGPTPREPARPRHGPERIHHLHRPDHGHPRRHTTARVPPLPCSSSPAPSR
ncbi:hypothetical protein DEJ15_01880 [Curtobacterium sp. MCJR17_043]|nr:hypothetical protein [Curtobacterium sp. MCJR17_043]WIB36055.1 hypothetical protein DEJ15_01880 [Curtobacterium sp. MCJR17_043]